MVVGDKKTEVCFIDGHNRTLTGRVVYIHPARRFYIVEFMFGQTADGRPYKFRETFYFPNRKGDKP